MKQWTPEGIKKLRATYKMTRGVLAELVGVLVITVYKWERGLIRPSKTAQLLLSRIEEELKQGMITLTDKRKRKKKGE